MEGQAFVLSVKPEEYTAGNGKVYPWATVQMLLVADDGTMGNPITCLGVSGLGFEGMGMYTVKVELRMKNERAGFRVVAMDSVKVF